MSGSALLNIVRSSFCTRFYTSGHLLSKSKSSIGIGRLGLGLGPCFSSIFGGQFVKNLVSFSLYPKDNLETSIKMHSEKTIYDFATFKIVVIPATQDNFMYLVFDKKSKQAFVVDPVEPESVLNVVKKEGVQLQGILTTHHHWDHAGGNEGLVKSYANLNNGNMIPVYGGDKRISGLTNEVNQGSVIEIGGLKIDCLFTPCHTSGHICYFLHPGDSNKEPPAVFTGDTLFIAGCGRFFEGTPEQMYSALIEKLSKLPDETRVFCGHEYTVANLKFALKVDPTNEKVISKLEWAEKQREKKIPTVPSTIEEEKQFNPFMRVEIPAMQASVGASDPISCMKQLRAMKDVFKA